MLPEQSSTRISGVRCSLLSTSETSGIAAMDMMGSLRAGEPVQVICAAD